MITNIQLQLFPGNCQIQVARAHGDLRIFADTAYNSHVRKHIQKLFCDLIIIYLT